MFSKEDLELFKAREILPEQVEVQLENFRKGFPFIHLDAPATPGNGIIQLSDQDIEKYTRIYEDRRSQLDVVKFVPASGAATRMFKEFFAYLEKSAGVDDEAALLDTFPDLKKLILSVERLPFISELEQELGADGTSLDELVRNNKAGVLLKKILYTPGLGYGDLPKGLIRFHSYPDHSRTSFEEHLVEGAQYARSGNSEVRLHFTVSPEHIDSFKHHLETVRVSYEDLFEVRFVVEFSIQQPYTDTSAVDMNNVPFRGEDGQIIFRPGGHGALLENLNGLDGDLIFIKNIDNIAPDRMKGLAIQYKKALAGLLIEFQDRVFKALVDLESDEIQTGPLKEICEFAGSNLCKMEDKMGGVSSDELKSALKELLNRPIRVAGMVRNAGEPGGGPFWVKQPDGKINLQIVEPAQISPEQADILKQSTHFNPVDLVCAVKDYQGKSFDLIKFRDPKTGFITEKSISGTTVKAQELPGLWNGSMAGWNTFFVEVPIETFTPVKTINDLIREEHLQNKY
jgi:hypothetical protein